MYQPIYFHEFTYKNSNNEEVTDLLIGTEDALDRLSRFYVEIGDFFKTLWHITDIQQVDTTKYNKIRIIR